MDVKRRVLNLMISLDQFVFSVITLGGSNPDETIPSAAYRLEQAGRRDGGRWLWATYRQALRDITAQTGFPFEVVWPVAP